MNMLPGHPAAGDRALRVEGTPPAVAEPWRRAGLLGSAGSRASRWFAGSRDGLARPMP